VTARKRSRTEWERWPRERLLDVRIRDLGLTLEGTWVESCIDELYRELERRDIALRPHCWLSDEWFSPNNVPGIAIPFYLVHPRLVRLERSMMHEAEGASRAECMRILRHEAGHAAQLSEVVREGVDAVSHVVPAQAGEPALRAAPPRVLCPSTSRRGFRRDVRGVDAAARAVAEAV
jgi:hypothetical protein